MSPSARVGAPRNLCVTNRFRLECGGPAMSSYRGPAMSSYHGLTMSSYHGSAMSSYQPAAKSPRNDNSTAASLLTPTTVGVECLWCYIYCRDVLTQ